MRIADTRFSDVPTEELGEKLDDWILRRLESVAALRHPNSIIPHQVFTTEDMDEGTLVQVRNGRHAVKADGGSGIIASDVVVERKSNRVMMVSPMANMEISLGMQDQPGSYYPLFLGDGGTISTTVPATGTVQRIGVALYYDKSNNTTFCRIQPDILGGLS